MPPPARRCKPLAPGERPLALRLSVALALFIAITNIVLLLAGYEVDGQRPSTAGSLIFAGLMVAAAIGMWQRRYWAVLGFEALLGIAIVFAAISLMVASNLAAAALCLGIIAVAAPLFWFLIRVMARIQLAGAAPARARRLASTATMPESATTASSSDPGRAGTWRRSARPSSA